VSSLMQLAHCAAAATRRQRKDQEQGWSASMTTSPSLRCLSSMDGIKKVIQNRAGCARLGAIDHAESGVIGGLDVIGEPRAVGRGSKA